MNWSSVSVRALMAALLLAVIAGLSIGFMPFSTVRSRLDRLSGDGSADAYTQAIHGRFQLAGWGGAIVAAGIFVGLLRYRRSLDGWAACQATRAGADLRALYRAARRAVRSDGLYLLIIFLLAIAIRIPNCNQPVSFDEAYTFNTYAKWPLPLIVTRYTEPNNHVFHSVLVHGCYQLFGDSRLAIRIPAFACGVLTPLLTFYLGRRSFGTMTAFCAALMTAVMPQIVYYSVNARGYTISIVLFLLAALAARLAYRRDNLAAWIVIVVSMALAIWTLPTMVYAAIGLFGWMLLKRRARKATLRPVIVAGAVTVAGAFLLYLPIALTMGSGGMTKVGGSYSKPFLQFVSDSPNAMYDAILWFGWAIPVACQWLIAAGVIFCLLQSSTRRILAPALAACLLILVPMALQRIEPPARIWIFAVPLVFIASAGGWFRITRRLAAGWRNIATPAVTIVVTMGVVVSILSHGRVLWSPETAIFPEADQVARDLVRLAKEKEPIITVTPASSTIIYNARFAGLPEVHFMPPGRGYTNDETAIVVTSRAFRQSPEDVLAELKLESTYDVSTATVIHRYETGSLWRLQKRAP